VIPAAGSAKKREVCWWASEDKVVVGRGVRINGCLLPKIKRTGGKIPVEKKSKNRKQRMGPNNRLRSSTQNERGGKKIIKYVGRDKPWKNT